MTDNVTPISSAGDFPDDFESFEAWTVPEVYNVPGDRFEDVIVAAGWTSAAGQTVKLGDHQYTLGEALQLSKALNSAVTLLADTMTVTVPAEWTGQ